MLPISIIVPVYNVANHLRGCVESIQSQTFKDWELILVDDGSSDGSDVICDELSTKDSRIRTFHQTNKGASEARNTGIIKARGEWIAFIDSDDQVDRDYLQTYYAEATLSGSQFIVGRIDLPGEKRCFHNTRVEKEEMICFVFENRLIVHSAPFCKLYNRGLVVANGIKFPKEIHMGEDALFMLDYLSVVESLATIDYCGYRYCINEGSLSSRIYPFEEEYECFKQWKQKTTMLIARYSAVFSNPVRMIYENRVSSTFERCICAILHRDDLTFIEKKRLLCTVPYRDVFYCAYYAKSSSLLFRITRWLLVFHLYSLFFLFYIIAVNYKCYAGNLNKERT